jgi:gliding motility-associated-like protein
MRLILLLLRLLLPGWLLAQPEYFERLLDSGTEDVARGIVLLPGRVAIAGYTEPTDRSSRRGTLQVTDRDGLLLHARNFPSERRNYFLDITPAPTASPDQFLMAGWTNDSITLDNWALCRMDTDGNQLGAFGWGEYLKDEEIFGLLTLPDGTIVGAGAESTTNHAMIARFTSEGDLFWRRNFTVANSRYTSLQRMAVAPDGILAVGWTTEVEATYPTILVKYDFDGMLLWQRQFDWPGQRRSGFRHIVRLPSGRILLLSSVQRSAEDTDIVLLQLDPGGNLERTATFGTDGVDLVSAVEPSPAGQEGFFLVGRHLPAGDEQSSAMFIGVENLLSPTLTAGLFAPGLSSEFSDMAIDEAGDFWLVGSARACPGGDRDVLLVKTNRELLTTASACDGEALVLDGEVLAGVVQSETGSSTERVDPPATALNAVPMVVTASYRSCPEYDLDADDSSGAMLLGFQRTGVCYEGPVVITDVDVLPVLFGTYTDSITIRLEGDRPSEYLRLDSPRSDTRLPLTLRNDGTRTDADFAALLAQVTYHNDHDTITAGFRRVTVRSYTGCYQSFFATSLLELLPDLTALKTLPDTFLCPGQLLFLDVTADEVMNYVWGDGAQDARREIREPGTYVLQRSNTCAVRLDTFRVTAATTADFPTLRPYPLCPGDSILIDLMTAGLAYRWADGDSSAARFFRQPNETTVLLTDGCTDTTLSVNVNAHDCCPIYLPNAFSPNGDGVNDRFRAFPHPQDCAPVTDFQLQVFDRWGGEVYRGESLTDGWDGRVADRPAMTGHYVYSISYHDGFVRRERRGGVVLLR